MSDPLEIKRRAAHHPDRPGEHCAAPPGRWLPIVDLRHCDARADCIIVCPNDVFALGRMDPEQFKRLRLPAKVRVSRHGRRVALTPNADQCRGCGLCVVACPEHALSLSDTRKGKAIEP